MTASVPQAAGVLAGHEAKKVYGFKLTHALPDAGKLHLVQRRPFNFSRNWAASHKGIKACESLEEATL